LLTKAIKLSSDSVKFQEIDQGLLILKSSQSKLTVDQTERLFEYQEFIKQYLSERSKDAELINTFNQLIFDILNQLGGTENQQSAQQLANLAIGIAEFYKNDGNDYAKAKQYYTQAWEILIKAYNQENVERQQYKVLEECLIDLGKTISELALQQNDIAEAIKWVFKIPETKVEANLTLFSDSNKELRKLRKKLSKVAPSLDGLSLEELLKLAKEITQTQSSMGLVTTNELFDLELYRNLIRVAANTYSTEDLTQLNTKIADPTIREALIKNFPLLIKLLNKIYNVEFAPNDTQLLTSIITICATEGEQVAHALDKLCQESIQQKVARKLDEAYARIENSLNKLEPTQQSLTRIINELSLREMEDRSHEFNCQLLQCIAQLENYQVEMEILAKSSQPQGKNLEIDKLAQRLSLIQQQISALENFNSGIQATIETKYDEYESLNDEFAAISSNKGDKLAMEKIIHKLLALKPNQPKLLSLLKNKTNAPKKGLPPAVKEEVKAKISTTATIAVSNFSNFKAAFASNLMEVLKAQGPDVFNKIKAYATSNAIPMVRGKKCSQGIKMLQKGIYELKLLGDKGDSRILGKMNSQGVLTFFKQSDHKEIDKGVNNLSINSFKSKDIDKIPAYTWKINA
jgi:hypothetical protein